MDTIKFSILILIAISISSLNVYANDDQCIKQFFNQSSFVCACDETNCDSIEVTSRVPKGYIIQWESSLEKYRFHQTQRLVSNITGSPNIPIGSNVIQVSLRLNDLRQTITGFGGAVTDASGFVLDSLPINLKDHILLDYFSPMGIEYSLVRVPIAGTDFSNRVYTYDDVDADDFDLKHFQLQPEDIQLKIPIIKRALELRDGSIRLFGSAWSPPAWMKTNHNISGSGFLKGSPGGPYYKTWAKYYVKFLEAYALNGINFWGITSGNEPTNALRNEDFFFNNLGMTPQMLRDFIKYDLGPVLRDSGYGKDKLEVLMYDDARQFLKKYADVVLSDAEAASFVTGIGFHWYQTGGSNHYDNLKRVNQKYGKYFLLSTEAAEGFERFSTRRAQLGNWTRAETYASDIIEDLNRGTTGWVDWNLVLNTGGGPSWVENYTDGLILVDVDRKIYYRNPMFYALGHFSKFIPPGSVYIGHSIRGNAKGVKLVSFKDPSGQLVMVILNTNDNPVDFVIDNFAEKSVPLKMDPHSIATLIAPKV